MSVDSASQLRFGIFEVDIRAGELRKNGLKIRLQDQPFQILRMLLEHPGKVVTREELRQRLWPTEVFVEFDGSLNTAVQKLREALSDSAETPRYIETRPRRGYRFIAPVEFIGAGPMRPETEVESPPLPPVNEELASAQVRIRRLTRQRLALLTGTITFALLAAAVFFRVSHRTTEARVRKFTLSAGSTYPTPAISPDGRYIASIAGENHQTVLRVQHLDSFEVRDLNGSAGVEPFFFWSPDSHDIGFARNGQLWRTPVEGGTPSLICLLPDDYLGGSWSPNGRSIAFSIDRKGIYEVPARGGVAKLIIGADTKTGGNHFDTPSYVPGEPGRRILLFSAQTRGVAHQAVIQDLETGRREILSDWGGAPGWSPTGHVLFPRSVFLWALPLSLTAMKPLGEGFAIAQTGFFPIASVARDGTLVYSSDDRRVQLTWRDRQGRELDVIEQAGLFSMTVSLSPDGRNIASTVLRNGVDTKSTNVWLYDISRRTGTFLASSGANDAMPIWHPNGTAVTYNTDRRGNMDIFIAPADGSREPEALVATPLMEVQEDWSRDGKFLLYTTKESDLWYLKKKDAGDGYESLPFLESPSVENQAALSPSGRFVAYVSNESGKDEIYVLPFPAGGGRSQISIDGGREPRWNPNGKELFYIHEGTLMVVPVAGSQHFSAGAARPLFSIPLLMALGRRHSFDVSPDGQRFVFVEYDGESRPAIRIVQNWFAEFSRQAEQQH